ncbi:MAG: site-2 protease family protein [Chloroflexi bacterium]|nr:site-2 protease family protein [Chloroflexota bacterium]
MRNWLLCAGMARWQIARVGAIPIRLHWSWALVPLLLIWARLGRPATWAPAEIATTLALAIAFGAGIVAHELGHAWVGRRAGIGGWEITLTAAGGLLTSAKLWPGRLRPGQEVLLALGGPAVSLGLAAVLRSLGSLVGHAAAAGWLDTLALANLAIAALNLVPVLPFDGGRILRALLTGCTDARAAPVIAWCSASLSLALLLTGLVLLAPGLLLAASVALVATWREVGRLIDARPDRSWAARTGLPVE